MPGEVFTKHPTIWLIFNNLNITDIHPYMIRLIGRFFQV